MVTTDRATTTGPAMTRIDLTRRRRLVGEHLRAVRTRIVAWVVLLAGLGLAAAGVTAYLVESRSIDARIDEAIHQEVAEFEELRRLGVDPNTGEPFTSVERLLKVALQRNVPDEHEAIVAFLGPARFVHPGATFPLGSYEPFRAGVVALGPDGGWGTVDTPEGEVRFAVKPVVQGDTRGSYVVAFFTGHEHAEFTHTMRTYAIVAAVVLLALTVAAWIVAGRLLRPLRLLRTTAQEIGDTDLARRIPVAGNDDVSDLARTFNAMLDRLEVAFTTQRRFLDDAGHELRTPITILRGHLELLDSADAGDVESTRALVLDELDRMSRLVDELVILAKAGRPDFLDARQLDLGELTDDILDKARALGERTWLLDSRGEGALHADRQRLTQALIQLAANAVQHTRPGDVVAVGSATGDGWARLWVRDTGPGVSAADAERIFERFERGAGASRGDGSGLGLSIVRAIAEAHGGHVLVDTGQEYGATFTLVLPSASASVDLDGPADEEPTLVFPVPGRGQKG